MSDRATQCRLPPYGKTRATSVRRSSDRDHDQDLPSKVPPRSESARQRAHPRSAGNGTALSEAFDPFLCLPQDRSQNLVRLLRVRAACQVNQVLRSIRLSQGRYLTAAQRTRYSAADLVGGCARETMLGPSAAIAC